VIPAESVRTSEVNPPTKQRKNAMPMQTEFQRPPWSQAVEEQASNQGEDPV